MQILILEASTSSAKAMIYDSQKGIIRVATRPYPQELSDVTTHDAQGVYEQLMRLGREVAEGNAIDAISIVGTWHSLLLCDESMQPKLRTQTWAYTGASAEAEEVSDAQAREFYNRTGCFAHAMYPLYKAAHLRKQGLVKSGGKILSQGSYIYYRMTGALAESKSMASGTAMTNVFSADYDETMLAFAGVSRRQLPPIVDNDFSAPLSADAARLLGLAGGIPVYTAQPDGAMNQIGANAYGDGIMTLSVGTSGALRVSSEKPVLNMDAGLWCYRVADKWLIGAATSGATNCVDWLIEKVLGGGMTYRELEAAMAEENEEPPTFLPFLYGERAPGWNSSRAGGFCGLRAAHGAGSLYRAVLEGVLFTLYQCYASLCASYKVPGIIHVSGGILHSKAWTQMLADILQRELHCAESEQTSLLGGALTALRGMGEIGDLRVVMQEAHAVEPRRENARLYAERFERYLRCYEDNFPKNKR